MFVEGIIYLLLCCCLHSIRGNVFLNARDVEGSQNAWLQNVPQSGTSCRFGWYIPGHEHAT